jgi:membrane protein DedA with SNARE-associated domain
MHDAFLQLKDWYLQSLDTGGYWLIVLLMAIESSIVPLPSEFVIPPVAYLAYSQGKMSITGVILAGTAGSWIGAALMYWAARLAGRPLVVKYGRYVFVTPEKVAAAESWAQQFGAFGVFFSRLLPIVRHLIGIPAGIVKLHFGLYSLYTILGSALWCGILCWVGIEAGKDEALMNGEMHRITLWAIGAFVVLGGAYFAFVHRQMKAKR